MYTLCISSFLYNNENETSVEHLPILRANNCFNVWIWPGVESPVLGEDTSSSLELVKVFDLEGNGIPISDLWKDRKAVVAFARHFGWFSLIRFKNQATLFLDVCMFRLTVNREESRWATTILAKTILWSFNKIMVSPWFDKIHYQSKHALSS
jgi:hypothetical protein